jgi:translocator protein
MLEIASKSQLRWAFLRAAAVFVPLLLAVGGLSAQFGKGAREGGWYDALVKPSINPPEAAFPIAWTILYIMMGFALAIVWHAKGNPLRRLGFTLFGAQIVLNFLWTPAFFGTKTPLYGLIVIALLLVALSATTLVFYRIRKLAGLLMVPCLVWVLFASYLNFQIWRLNPDASTISVTTTAPIDEDGNVPVSPGVIPL